MTQDQEAILALTKKVRELEAERDASRRAVVEILEWDIGDDGWEKFLREFRTYVTDVDAAHDHLTEALGCEGHLNIERKAQLAWERLKAKPLAADGGAIAHLKEAARIVNLMFKAADNPWGVVNTQSLEGLKALGAWIKADRAAIVARCNAVAGQSREALCDPETAKAHARLVAQAQCGAPRAPDGELCRCPLGGGWNHDHDGERIIYRETPEPRHLMQPAGQEAISVCPFCRDTGWEIVGAPGRKRRQPCSWVGHGHLEPADEPQEPKADERGVNCIHCGKVSGRFVWGGIKGPVCPKCGVPQNEPKAEERGGAEPTDDDLRVAYIDGLGHKFTPLVPHNHKAGLRAVYRFGAGHHRE